jgi:hypothetical protein
MALRPKGLGMAPRDNLLLSTLCQIGDVALVHDETALNLPPLTEREGCIRFTGCDVQAHDGTLLGKVSSSPAPNCYYPIWHALD